MQQAQSTYRLRFRDQSIKIGSMAYALRDNLLELRGIIKVEVNKRTGSILVLFDKAQIGSAVIFDKILATIGIDSSKIKDKIESAGKTITTKACRNYVNKGTLITGAITLGALAFSKKTHAIAGVVFIGFAGLHLIQNKKRLLQ
ncbi:MAG: hypothetical protein OCC45_04630 [Desulfotalea sp.]